MASDCKPYTPASRKIPDNHFCYRLNRPQGYSAAGRAIEKPNDLLGIESATFRLVAPSTNHATAYPLYETGSAIIRISDVEYFSDNVFNVH
jgi:hypothetical protein